MKEKRIVFIDSHVHLDTIFANHPYRIEWLKEVRCVPVSWAFGQWVGSVAGLKQHLKTQQETIHRIQESGLNCFFLTGVHPVNIPADLKPEQINEILSPFLDDSLCLGIGEIGLETADSQEKEILTAQLEMAPEVIGRGKVFGVHTPRRDKTRVTAEALTVLKGFAQWWESIVVDHCLPETIGTVLDEGFYAGVTLNPAKASIDDIGRIINDHPDRIDRIILSTDSGSGFFEDLYLFSSSTLFPENIRLRLSKENALSFYKISE